LLFYRKTCPDLQHPFGTMPKACRNFGEDTGIMPKACGNFGEDIGITLEIYLNLKQLTQFFSNISSK
jgi:hypothetical protein